MEGVNSAGKRVSLLNDEAPAVGGCATAALPYHHGPPGAPKPTLPRTALDAWKPSYSSLGNSSTTTSSTTTTTTASYPSSSSSAHNNSPSDSDSPHPSSRDSRHSSTSNTPPQFSPSSRSVPQLLRHDSTSSSQSVQTPSPMTPATFYEPLDQGSKAALNGDPTAYAFAQALNGPLPHHHSAAALSQQAHLVNANAFYPTAAQVSLPAAGSGMYSAFPPVQPGVMSDPFAMTGPAMQYQFATELIDPITPATGLASASLAAPVGAANGQPPVDPNAAVNGNSASGSSSQQKAKKKYPCPYAQRYNCTDTFTTSGHAARHGKKHTGEKNILCPTCHKAFTRKDNMKQHERTHKNRNNNSVDETGKTNIVSGNSRRTHSISSVAASAMSHKSSNSTEMELDSPPMDPVDSKRNSLQRPSLGRPAQYTAAPVSNGDVKVEHSLQAHRPELNRQFSGESQDGEGESPGLDALAMAASELR